MDRDKQHHHEPEEAGPYGTRPADLETTAAARAARVDPDLARQEKARRAAASRRYAGRRTLWEITGDRACRACGRAVMDPDTGAIQAQTAEGYSVLLGVLKCGRIWLCPICSAKIRNRRTSEISQAVVKWIKAGGSAYAVTFTPRHTRASRLSDLMDALQGTRSAPLAEREAAKAAIVAAKLNVAETWARRRAAVDAARRAAPKGQKREAMADAREVAAEWLQEAKQGVLEARQAARGKVRKAGAYQRLITGGTWAGGPEHGEGIRNKIGYIGMIRATEVTVGLANGFHPHIHAIVLVGGRTEGGGWDKRVVGTFEPEEEDLAEWKEEWRTVWTGSLKAIDPTFEPSLTCEIPDCKCNGEGHGVHFERLKTVRDAERFGEYLAKTQDGKNPAAELAGAHNKAAWKGNMAPFQLLTRIGELLKGKPPHMVDGHGSLEQCLEWWAEYEEATSGRRAIEWTRYLRSLLGLTGGDDDEDNMDLLFEGEAVSEFRAGVQIRTGAWHKVAATGHDQAVSQATEGNGICLENVVGVVEAAGGRAEDVRLLSSGELQQLYDGVIEGLQQRRLEADARRKLQQGRRTPKPQRLAALANDDQAPADPVPAALAEALARPEPDNLLGLIRQAARARRGESAPPATGAHPAHQGAHQP
ncbi:hypothetical protein PUR71_14880 [Streptomyces sp. SP17BM10]|uniref:hypothetical protein n=1 Tax=Streptomyces sp. SP17BM10 TaxID=3002530 RepID=UPI002E75AF77|nr:hypothetical protein [Streptomyces sp. SP17BM10]MEE1784172.1 hypothetical protein [Streptomyces sp. SP17BM10]